MDAEKGAIAYVEPHETEQASVDFAWSRRYRILQSHDEQQSERSYERDRIKRYGRFTDAHRAQCS